MVHDSHTIMRVQVRAFEIDRDGAPKWDPKPSKEEVKMQSQEIGHMTLLLLLYLRLGNNLFSLSSDSDIKHVMLQIANLFRPLSEAELPALEFSQKHMSKAHLKFGKGEPRV
jgi:hypothetical protein